MQERVNYKHTLMTHHFKADQMGLTVAGMQKQLEQREAALAQMEGLKMQYEGALISVQGDAQVRGGGLMRGCSSRCKRRLWCVEVQDLTLNPSPLAL